MRFLTTLVSFNFISINLFYHAVTATNDESIPSIQTIENAGCNYELKSQNLDAPFIISALFPIQKFKASGRYEYQAVAITWVESFLYTLNAINNNQSILPNVTLGFDIRNTCNNERVAIQHTLDLMVDRAYMPPQQLRQEDDEETKNLTTSSLPAGTEQCTCANGETSRMIGVVGK